MVIIWGRGDERISQGIQVKSLIIIIIIQCENHQDYLMQSISTFMFTIKPIALNDFWYS